MTTKVIQGLDIRMHNGGTLALNELPARSIALDGAVQGPVMGDNEDRWSFDHHADCSRLITDATCQQVHKALVLGLDISDRPIHINDIDGDTLLSLWLLARPMRDDGGAVRSLVHAVGTIDAHGPAGARLLPHSERLMSDAFYARLRAVLPRDVQAEYGYWPTFVVKGFEVIESVLSDHLNGELREEDNGIESEVVWLFHGQRGGVKAIIARSLDFGTFGMLYDAGFRLVVLVSDAPDNSYRYTIGKLSDLVSYPLGPGNDPDSLLGQLNDLEPGWGGGSSIGGSPRLEGGVSSRLTPEGLWALMNR